jgi:ADP-dependent phosphofructokinase/glucokinase
MTRMMYLWMYAMLLNCIMSSCCHVVVVVLVQESIEASKVSLLFPDRFRMSQNLPEQELDPHNPVVCDNDSSDAKQSGIFCCVTPVLVCNKPKRLVGLGDHISASGLAVYM